MGERLESRALLAVLAAMSLLGAAACGDGNSGNNPGGDGGTGGAGGTGGSGGGDEVEPRLAFIDMYPAISISADGKVAVIVDSLSGTNDVYFYDVATGALEKKTETGAPDRHVNGLSGDGTHITGSRGIPETPSVWSETSGWVDLPSPYATGCDGLGSGWGLDADGSVVVGMLFKDDCGVVAARWTKTGGEYVVTELEELGDTNRATVVSADGKVAAGFTHTAMGNRTPALWRDDGTGLLLAPAERLGDFGEVLAISADGSMVAGMIGVDGFIWTEENGFESIGSMPDPLGHPLTVVGDIAADETLVFGGAGHRVFTTQRAFVWTAETGIRSLEEIVRRFDLEVPEGFVLSHVMGASSDGTVLVGFASDPETQDWISFVLELPVSAYDDDGTGGTGGTGGDPTREESCRTIVEAWAACGAETTGMEEACLANEQMSDERLAGCAECTVAATCNQLLQFACEAACSPARAGLVIRGAGFEGAEGRTVNIDVVDEAGVSLLGYGTVTSVLPGGVFRVELQSAFPEGVFARVLAWLDLDDDAVCGSALDRHAIVEIPALSGETEVVISPELPDEPSICAGFDWVMGHLVFRVTGLEGVPDGAAAVVKLFQTYEGGEGPAGAEEATVADGAFTVTLRSAIGRDLDYVVRWFADSDGSETCDATDAGGTVAFHGAPGTLTVDGTPDPGAPSCPDFYGWGYTVSFHGTGFDVANDLGIQGYLFDTVTGEVVATGWGAVLDGVLGLDFVEAVPGGFDVELVYSIDVDLDGVCAAPPDLVGRLHVGTVSADASFEVSPASGDPSGVCTQLDALFGG